jgi:MFS family permease
LVALAAAAPALLCFALIEGPSWGWADPRVIAALALGAALVPVFAWRTRAARHPAVDLSLFRMRPFLLINVGSLLFGAAFYSSLLINIVFLQTVWHYSVLVAALATTPGPLVVMAVARPAGRLSAAIGPRLVLLAGAAVWAGGMAYYALVTTGSPDWPGHWLPATLLTGLGVGLTIPVQSAAAVAALPPTRLAIGSGINWSFRQLGSVLGVSLFVVVLGTPTAVTAVAAFDRVRWMFAAFALASATVLFIPSRATLGRHLSRRAR